MEAGESFEVTDRGRPVARLVPVLADRWEELLRTGWVAKARRLLGRVHVVPLDRGLLDDAARLGAGDVLRSLDAIHLAAAFRLGPELGAVVTYDERMTGAANALGLPLAAPS